MTLVASLRTLQLSSRLAAYADTYKEADDDAVAAHQFTALNAAWAVSLTRSPWARNLQRTFNLPAHFQSLAAFDAAVPIMSKRELGSLVTETSTTMQVAWRATGGSTGEPFRFPIWREEQHGAGLDVWLGRQRLAIEPSARLFLLWGHAHLLGSGWRGALNKLKRQVSDQLLGYSRCSAYDLSDDSLARACGVLLQARPQYVVGYSGALDRFARVNTPRRAEIARLGLTAVIATGEAFPHPESRALIAQCFGAPVFMEYGAVETGPLAYEDVGGRFQVFWARHRLTRRGGSGPDADEILVTSLYPRALPLLRYRLGDLAEAEPSGPSGAGLQRVTRIIGRCNDVIPLASGVAVHSEAFTHCMRDAPGVRAFQVVAGRDALPRLHYEAESDLDGAAVAEIRRRLAIVDPVLAGMAINRVDHIARSVAGKHRFVVAE